MPYITAGDLSTHIFPENIEEITRMDADILNKAIQRGISEAKGYIRRFDLVRLFGTETIEPDYEAEDLKDKVLDLITWKLVKLGNPNISYESARESKDDALRWFRDIQAGKIDPGWPMPADDTETSYTENTHIQWSSNPRRNNNF